MNRDQTDPEQAERVRRIQEEIRRKIAARRAPGGGPPPLVPPGPPLEPFNPLRPVFREEPVAPLPRPTPPAMPPVRETAPAYDDEAAVERQNTINKQLAELETRRREVRRAAQALAETGAAPTTARENAKSAQAASVASTAGARARSLADDLRDPAALRRAMVLREVLDAPVALRRG